MADLVLHTGHTSKHFNISHSVHIAICPQLQFFGCFVLF